MNPNIQVLSLAIHVTYQLNDVRIELLPTNQTARLARHLSDIAYS